MGYEIWDVYGGNCLAVAPTRQAALSWLADLVKEQGTAALQGLSLGRASGGEALSGDALTDIVTNVLASGQR